MRCFEITIRHFCMGDGDKICAFLNEDIRPIMYKEDKILEIKEVFEDGKNRTQREKTDETIRKKT